MARHILYLVFISALVLETVLATPRSGMVGILERQDPPLSCETKCVFETCGAGSCAAKRDVLALVFNEETNFSAEATSLSWSPWSELVDRSLEKRIFNLVAPWNTPDTRPARDPLGRIKAYVQGQLTRRSGDPSRVQGDTSYAPTNGYFNTDDDDEGLENVVIRQGLFSEDPANPRARGEKFQLGTTNLIGCTMITIVSEVGVWSAHFWEVFSNGGLTEYENQGRNPPPGGWPDTDDASDPAFQQRVLDVLRGRDVLNPAPLDALPYLSPVGATKNNDVAAGSARDFQPNDAWFTNGGNCYSFIMAPTPYGEPVNAAGNNFRYPRKAQAIQEFLIDKYPNCRVISQPYYAALTGSDREYLASRIGTWLFQYDPDYDGNQTPGWRLFQDNVRFEYPTDFGQ